MSSIWVANTCLSFRSRSRSVSDCPSASSFHSRASAKLFSESGISLRAMFHLCFHKTTWCVRASLPSSLSKWSSSLRSVISFVQLVAPFDHIVVTWSRVSCLPWACCSHWEVDAVWETCKHTRAALKQLEIIYTRRSMAYEPDLYSV